MTVTIKAVFKNSTKETGYETHVEVVDAVGIGLDIFVANTEDATFSHVASVFDMETYPASQAAAAALNQKFFRGRSLTRTDSTISSAAEFERVTKSRIQLLADSWETAEAEFQTTELVTFVSSGD